tara:strand:+ start:370 stop:969 length:600 start_codon:yes stop_codon:yes gene_type:complete
LIQKILYSLVTIPTLLIFWQIFHILSTPNLLSRLRNELAPYANITKPFSIGAIFEAPKMALTREALAEKCPLLRSTYLETLRLVDHAGLVSREFKDGGSPKEEITFPETFDPVRFLEATRGKMTSHESSDNEYISEESILFTEQVVLAVVASILVFWDFEPAEKGSGWKNPGKQWSAGIAVPVNDFRVRVRRRKFEWDA